MIIYEVNKDKQTIVARFEGGKEYWRQSLIKMCFNILYPTDTSTYIIDPVVDSIVDTHTNFVGKAICHKDDEWDEEIGKKIAKDRLLQKWYEVKDRVLLALGETIKENYALALERLNKRLIISDK